MARKGEAASGVSLHRNRVIVHFNVEMITNLGGQVLQSR